MVKENKKQKGCIYKIGAIIVAVIVVVFIFGQKSNDDENKQPEQATQEQKTPTFQDNSNMICFDHSLVSVDNTGITYNLIAWKNTNELKDVPYQSSIMNINLISYKNKSYTLDPTNNQTIYPPQIKVFVDGIEDTTGIITFTQKDETKKIKIFCSDITNPDDYTNLKIIFNERSQSSKIISGKEKVDERNNSYLSCEKK